MNLVAYCKTKTFSNMLLFVREKVSGERWVAIRDLYKSHNGS